MLAFVCRRHDASQAARPRGKRAIKNKSGEVTMFKMLGAMVFGILTGMCLCTPVEAAISSEPWGTTVDDGRADVALARGDVGRERCSLPRGHVDMQRHVFRGG